MTRTNRQTIVKILLLLLLSLPLLSIRSAYALQGYLYTGQYGQLHWNVSPGGTISYYINYRGTGWVPGDSEFIAVQNGFQAWEDDSGSYIDFTYMGTTDLGASLYWGVRDYYNILEWIYVSDATWLARTYFHYYVVSGLIIEEDTVFNDFYPWTTTGQTDRYDVQNAATHEAGHFLFLYDLTESGDEDQTMWWSIPSLPTPETKKRTLEWGDRAGVRYIYPNTYQVGGGTLGSESQDGDVAIGYINSGSVLDMVVAWADNPSGDNYAYHRTEWEGRVNSHN